MGTKRLPGSQDPIEGGNREEKDGTSNSDLLMMSTLTKQPRSEVSQAHTTNLLRAPAPFASNGVGAVSLASKPWFVSLDGETSALASTSSTSANDGSRRTISVKPSLASLPESPAADHTMAGDHTTAAGTTAGTTTTVTTATETPSVPHASAHDPGKWKSKMRSYKQSFADFARIFTYSTWTDRLFLCISVIVAVGAGSAFPIMTIVFGQLIGKIASVRAITVQQAQDGYRHLIGEYVLYLVYLFVARLILGYIATLGFRILSLRISSSIRLAYVRALLELPVSLLDTQPPGQIAAIITTTANTLQIGISEKLAIVIQTSSLVVTALVVAFVHSWKLSVVTSSGLVLITVCYGLTIPFLVANMRQVEDADIRASAVASESFSAIRMIAACGAETKMVDRYRHWVEEANRRGLKLSGIVAAQQATSNTFALAFWFAVKLLMNGEIENVGITIIVLMCVMLLAVGVGNIAAPISAAARSAGAARILFNGIDAPRPVTTGLKHPDVSASGDIVLWNVNFTYPTRPNLKVLDNLNLVIPAGKVTAIVGPSGSGKSTIVALVQRWYEMDGDYGDKRLILYFRNGSVTIGGKKLTDLDLKWWRSQIGLVQQEPFLFNQTILENVASGLVGTEWEGAERSVKEEMVRAACKEAYADEFISRLPEGYDTHVGDAGIKLSGGQRQRLAIARAIIKQPKILILDEATSSIDVRGEKVVQAALDRVSKNRTTIMIAHRLATVKKADNIVVLAKGKVVQWGTHESLMGVVGGPYWLLTQSQELKMGGAGGGAGDEAYDDVSEVTEEEKRTMDLMTLDESTGSQRPNELGAGGENGAGWKARGVFRSFGTLLLEQRSCSHWYILMLLGALIAGASPPVQAYIFANLIASFALWGELLRVVTNFWCLMFIALASAAALSYFCLGFASTRVAFHITSAYRLEYFTNIIAKKVSWFDGDGRSVGALTGLVATDPTQLQQLLGTNITFTVISVLSVVGCLSISLYFGWKLTLVAFSSATPLALAAGFFRIRVEKRFEALNVRVFAESARFATESVGAIRTVTALTLEDAICKRYEELLRDHVRTAFGQARFSTLVFAASDSLPLLAMAFVLWYGGTLLVSGEYMTFNYLVVYIAVVQGAIGAGQWLSFAPNIAQAAAAANRIQSMRMHDHQSDVPGAMLESTAELGEDNERGVRIELRDVWFKYPTRDVPVLSGLNITIEKGQFAAIVGPSGEFYQVTSGCITFDGIDIDTLALSSYRRSISLVAQEPSLFDGTIRENILLGMFETVSDARMHGVCRDAGIHDFVVSLPEGYDTRVGTRGVLLSGGQRQRVAIARALVRDPRVLLLDEATSSLDSETERMVQRVFERESTRRGRTMVVVAHRLATVQNADVIFVLGDGGRVLERGTHGELLARRGVYYSMCQGQALDR
ncbi:ABC transporter-like protein [Xylariaceae sp. FL0594]|nr:ABC transporter-like protein [Xylariaceae sp. FL0594]